MGFALTSIVLFSCNKEEASPGTNTNTNTNTTSGIGITTTTVADVYKKMYGASDMYIDGDYLVIKSKGMPDHKSPYYKGTTYEATMYEANASTTFKANPSKIAEQALTFRIPLNPKVATTHASTPLGPIGVGLNGVAFYNQYAAGMTALDGEKVSFDQYDGHPNGQSMYHYHIEPLWLTTKKGKDALMGFLLDGFPVYGPVENGKTLMDADLDKYHGHSSKTADYPTGIYHYHFTAEAPYLNGDGFYGTAGTVTQ